MKKFGEKNLDVLQNIEFGIVEVYRADRVRRATGNTLKIL